jgi:lantibiotic modifying enzyme
MEEVQAALSCCAVDASVPAAFGAEHDPSAAVTAADRARALAWRLGETLRASAHPAPGNRGVYWQTAHRGAGGLPARDINIGDAGTLLALAELTDQFDDPSLRECLSGGAAWLVGAPALAGEPLPGLYVGEAGIAAALLRAGQVLGNDDLVAAAADRAGWIASLPHRSPDLFNGSAGRLRVHLLLRDATGDPTALDAAIAAGDFLLETAELAAPDEAKWTIPAGYGGLSGTAGVGYAHGAAGIADALLDLWEATADERYLDAAVAAARWLRRLAVPVLADGSGLGWPSEEDDDPTPGFWCHGAAGVGLFFLHAARVGVVAGAGEIAARAARAVARGTRWASPTQCHGLAGNIEFLLDVYQSTGDPGYLSEARSLGALLETFGHERDGRLVWPAELPWIVTPDYMVGYAGVAACLLRLADPARRPHGLSRAGFRFRAWPESRRGRPKPAVVRREGRLNE